MVLLVFFLVHWYVSLFFQSIFHHRYAAHGLFTMSPFMEKVFYVGCWLTQGSSYISAYTYGIMHRLHHAHTDTPEDPHSPHNSPNLFTMMWDTRSYYFKLHTGKIPVEPKYSKGVPNWPAFDKIMHNYIVRLLWIALYFFLYTQMVTATWQYIFLPLTCVMSSLQGAIVNWGAHKFGYENFSMTNTSKNILPFDFLFWGEAYHNNHHRHPQRPNNAARWFEWDMGYYAMRLMHRLGLIKMVA